MNNHQQHQRGSTQFHVRDALSSDVSTIARFNCQMALETESLQLDPETVRDGVARGLRHAPEVQYLVACQQDGTAIGTLMLTREWSDWRCGWFYWIQSVYVAESYRGMGVFQSLLAHASETVSAAEDSVGLRLYVEQDNEVAKRIYCRCGFERTDYLVYELKLPRS